MKCLMKILGFMLLATISSFTPAHQSHGNYEMTEYVHLEGIVRQLHMVNPHAWIYLEVKQDGGDAEMWHWRQVASVHSLEMESMKIQFQLVKQFLCVAIN